MILLKHDCKHIELFLNVHKIGKLVILSDNYHNIGRLLPLTIIVDSKNWTISIIVKENITVNRQNRPSLVSVCMCMYVCLSVYICVCLCM